ncbi:hypothetical protein BDA96_01G519900 [Sorghum bicolor]|uniref:Uncharacterized protein n=1 Tax=Sorghum bicolor TaxID=4558 RepID=A0A921S5N9_SORBI|nr:hypothetical protein BDA96_01G519900 [Sorghum bicolor]
MKNVKRVQEENIKRARDESQSFIQNDCAVPACAQNSFLESSKKHQRISTEKNYLPQNEARSIVKNGQILQVHPVQNNPVCSIPRLFPICMFPHYNSATLIRICCFQPPHQCFNKWDHNLPLHSSWPPLYLPPQQCFNMPGGLSGSGYAPLAPPHVLHGYGDYQ